jgi:hypothetical protein
LTKTIRFGYIGSAFLIGPGEGINAVTWLLQPRDMFLKGRNGMKSKLWTAVLLVLLLATTGILAGSSTSMARSIGQPGSVAGSTLRSANSAVDGQVTPESALACSVPVTRTIRGKSVQFDQCYEQTFSHNGTDYTVHVFYTETNSATNTSQCNATENANGRCEHAISDNDDTNGDNVNAVALADEGETALRFYIDRNLQVLSSGSTTLSFYIAEDPRLGGVIWPNSIYVDDDGIDNNDTLQKRLLAFHEMQHLIQDKYDSGTGWLGFFGEGIARAIEDRVNPALDADTGHLFIPEVNGILGNNGQRTSDLSTLSYRSVLWWTWLMDRYRLPADTDPVIGWSALRDFYLELDTESDQLTAVRDFIGGKGSSFWNDLIDYTLALYAYRYDPADERIGFLDAQINATAGLSGHNVFTTGPAFSTVSQAMNPRSSRYWEFTPANQCDYIAFTFDGNGKSYGFSVMTVDGGNLDQRWTSSSTEWARTVRSADLDRVVGVVTAVDESGTVDVGRGCVAPTLDIKSPTTASFVMVGLANNPRHFITRLQVQGADGGAVAGLVAGDFQVQIQKAGGGPLIDATVVNATYVQDDYWLLVQAPSDGDGAESGAFYDLVVTLGSNSDTESSALLYVERTQDVVVVLDRSGSMGGTTGKIEAARNAANLLVNELSPDDQGSFVAFDSTASLREPLALVTGTHRSDLYSAISAETPGGATSIGDGLETAATEEDANGIAANMCSFVLLSDGHENTAPFWADVRSGVVDNGCAIHTIALGPGTNELLMQQIAASVPGGTYDYATNSGGVPLSLMPTASGSADSIAATTAGFLGWENNLSRIYDFKAAQLAGRQRLASTSGGFPASACVGFEDLTVGTRYTVGAVFSSSGAEITPKPFTWSNGQITTNGYTEVDDGQLAGASGNDMQVNNINLAFDFGGPVSGLSLNYGEYGGNLNIEINGDFRNFNRFLEIDGLTIGGVQVAVFEFGNGLGSLELTGTIHSFAIGGQELWIDQVCPRGGEGETFYVDDASDKLVVSVAWQKSSGGTTHSQLFDPDGNPVPTSLRRLAPTGTNEVWEVPGPQEGNWSIKVQGLEQEYFVSASARTLYEMYLFVGTPITDRTQGIMVPLLATFVAKDRPLTGAMVVAHVKSPDGINHTLTLFDDGNHGDGEADDGVYGNTYTATSLADMVESNPEKVVENEEPQVVGSYLVTAVGVKGDIRREAQGSFAIQPGQDSDGDRIPDLWEETHGLDPNNGNDAGSDSDRDKLNAYCEFRLGTDPRNSDTDGGGESDGSETGGRCVAPDLDPLDPRDDRVGPLSGVIAYPEADQSGPRIRLVLGRPLLGDLFSANTYRRVFAPNGEPLEDWQFYTETVGAEIVDTGVQDGFGYAYLVVPAVTISGTEGMTATGRVERSNIALASTDPYAPGGSVLINNGADKTDSLTVTLSLAVDDSLSGGDGSPDEVVPGSSPGEIMMRLSNSPSFDGVDWQPFQAEVPGWRLGQVFPGNVATVYVQFKDAKGNVSDSGFGLMDSILYEGHSLFLPVVLR